MVKGFLLENDISWLGGSFINNSDFSVSSDTFMKHFGPLHLFPSLSFTHQLFFPRALGLLLLPSTYSRSTSIHSSLLLMVCAEPFSAVR